MPIRQIDKYLADALKRFINNKQAAFYNLEGQFSVKLIVLKKQLPSLPINLSDTTYGFPLSGCCM